MESINKNLNFSSTIIFTNITSVSASNFLYPLVKISIISQRAVEWGPLIKFLNLFKVSVFISSV